MGLGSIVATAMAQVTAVAQIQYDKGDFAELDLNADPSLDFDME